MTNWTDPDVVRVGLCTVVRSVIGGDLKASWVGLVLMFGADVLQESLQSALIETERGTLNCAEIGK